MHDALHLQTAGKRSTGASVDTPPADNAPPAGDSASSSASSSVNTALYYIYDRSSSRTFLVDTGSDDSLVPPTSYDKKYVKLIKNPARRLVAANGSTIKQYGKRVEEIAIGTQKYKWRCTVADVTQPI